MIFVSNLPQALMQQLSFLTESFSSNRLCNWKEKLTVLENLFLPADDDYDGDNDDDDDDDDDNNNHHHHHNQRSQTP
jgi:hypothetical protein